MPTIDDRAMIHPKAEIADDVVIGPFTVVGEHVRIGPKTIIDSHCVIDGHTELGAGNHLHPFVSIGTPPQDHSYRGEPTRLLVGDRNEFREFVTANRGTVKGGGVTIIGNDNLFMACSHVAHDCVIGDHVVMANCALLAGHVKVESGAILSGQVAVHHFVTLGAICMLGGMTGVTRDVPPFMMVQGDARGPRAVNVIGMQRNGYSSRDIESVQRLFRLIYRTGTGREEARRQLEEANLATPAAEMVLESLRRSEMGKLGRYMEIYRMERGGAAK